MTIGTLIRKIEPHQKQSSSNPPSKRTEADADARHARPDRDRFAPLLAWENVG